MKYRSRADLIAVVLSSAAKEGGAPLTRIMYNSFLSYPQIKQFSQFLLEHGLLEHNELEKVYKTTGKGFQYLELYKQMEELINFSNNPSVTIQHARLTEYSYFASGFVLLFN